MTTNSRHPLSPRFRRIAMPALVALAALAVAAVALAAGGKGKLTFVNAIFDGQGDATMLDHGCDAALAPSGKHVYTTACNDHAVVAFTRSTKTGKIRFVNGLQDGVNGVNGLEGAEDLIVSPDGRNVYVIGYSDNAVVVLRRNPRSGRISFVQTRIDGTHGITKMSGPESVVVSPDGKNVYVSAEVDDAIVVFKRVKKGKLIFQGSRMSPEPLVQPWGMEFTSDGRSLYVAYSSNTTGGVGVFRRNLKTGGLKPVQRIVDDVTRANQLDYAFVTDVSPDDRFVYVAAVDDEAISVFRRNQKTGKLTIIQELLDDGNAGDYLDAPYDMVVTPDGRNAYAVGYSSDAIVTFTRNRRTGRLKFLNNRIDGVNGVEGLNGVWRLDADNYGVVGASYEGSSVASFKRAP